MRSTVQARRWTRAEYERMVAAGILTPDDRVELIDGEIVTRTPQGSAHATSVSLVQEALRSAFGTGAHVRTQLPLAIGPTSEPEPDAAVVVGPPRAYREAHPQSALLVIEVADATLDYDRETKGSLYARAGLPDYWIVNLQDRVVEVHRDPVSDPQAPFGWRYATRERFGPADAIAPLARPDAPVEVADLLP